MSDREARLVADGYHLLMVLRPAYAAVVAGGSGLGAGLVDSLVA